MNNFDEIQRVLGPIPLGPVVGGKPLDGDGMIPVVDPATEEIITEIANGTVTEALTAVGVAHHAQDAWAEISPRLRSEILRRAFDLTTERGEALARLIVLENGKALPDARSEVAYVYARDLRTGLRVAERLDSGMVGLNRPVVSDPAAPFGGTKQSGLGREGGHEGMLELTESKYVAVEW